MKILAKAIALWAFGKLIVASAFFNNDGLYPKIRESFFQHATPANMPAELRDAYNTVAPNPEDLPTLVAKLMKRMREFKDWRPEDIQSIKAPTLVVGDADMLRPEHAVQMFRLLPHAQLAVLPGTTHFTLMDRADLLLSMIPPFLDAPMPEAK